MDDDLRSLRDMDPDDEEDLFGGFSDESLEEIEDPFASLDELGDSDPFANLKAPQDEDLFGAAETAVIEETRPLQPPETAPRELPQEGDETPDWLRELGVGTEEAEFAAASAEEERAGGSPAAPPQKAARPHRGAFGMTAQQRMVLAIFLFLDVLVLSFLILLVIGAIQI